MNITKIVFAAMIVCGLHGVAHAQNEPPPSTMDGAAPTEVKKEEAKPAMDKAPKGKHKKGKKHADH